MNTIYALTDYKNHYGSKWNSKPYRSGYDKKYLIELFKQYNYELNFIQFKDVDLYSNWQGKVVIYTSSEEVGRNYKSYIEDIVLSLEKAGAIVIPNYDFLRAHENKVYMELLRDRLLGKELSGNTSRFYGTVEELKQDIDNKEIKYPVVIKSFTGAMSKNVYSADDESSLLNHARKISRSPNHFYEVKDFIRQRKHKDYQLESKYQNKFIVQPLIPKLKNDWKIVIYGDHYYILSRGIKEGDFRASGSHYNYKAGSKSDFPVHMLDSVEQIYSNFKVPHLSLDFAYDGRRGYIHEFQAIYFGTSTLEFSNDYYRKVNGKWVVEEKELDQEGEYVYSIVKFLDKHGINHF